MGSALALSPQTFSQTQFAVLQVLGGVHRGVVLPILAPIYRIGSGPSSDVVLGDEGVAADHAVVRFSGGGAFVEARGGDVSLSDAHVIPRGQGCRVRLPVELSIGSSRIRLNRSQQTPYWMQPRFIAAGVAALIVVGSVVATQAALSARDTSAAPAASRAAAVDLAAPAAGTDPVGELKRRVAESGVQGLRIEADGDRIIARGAIEDADRKKWAATQRWFDETYGERYVLASEVGAKSAATMPRFQVQAVWYGDSPYVITADGQRRYAGATLSDGWVIKRIEHGRLIVAKGGEEVALNF